MINQCSSHTKIYIFLTENVTCSRASPRSHKENKTLVMGTATLYVQLHLLHLCGHYYNHNFLLFLFSSSEALTFLIEGLYQGFWNYIIYTTARKCSGPFHHETRRTFVLLRGILLEKKTLLDLHENVTHHTTTIHFS